MLQQWHFRQFYTSYQTVKAIVTMEKCLLIDFYYYSYESQFCLNSDSYTWRLVPSIDLLEASFPLNVYANHYHMI